MSCGVYSDRARVNIDYIIVYIRLYSVYHIIYSVYIGVLVLPYLQYCTRYCSLLVEPQDSIFLLLQFCEEKCCSKSAVYRNSANPRRSNTFAFNCHLGAGDLRSLGQS